MLLGFDDYQRQAQLLAEMLDMPCHIVHRHRFPDGENKLTLPSSLPNHVVICRSLNNPNEKLLELLLTAKTARRLGAKKITLVAPYLCYMRQDKEFHPGEVVSQTIVGSFLADLFDNVITVDPHLHRIERLEQAIPTAHAVTLSATALMADFIRGRLKDPILLGPDIEAEQWVSQVANSNQWDYAVCQKIRSGDHDVEVVLPEIDMQQRSVVIVDDIASSGQTLAVAAEKCLSAGASQVDVLITHALFSEQVKQQLIEVGISNIWSTDSVSHESNIIPLKGLLGDAVLELWD